MSRHGAKAVCAQCDASLYVMGASVDELQNDASQNTCPSCGAPLIFAPLTAEEAAARTPQNWDRKPLTAEEQLEAERLLGLALPGGIDASHGR